MSASGVAPELSSLVRRSLLDQGRSSTQFTRFIEQRLPMVSNRSLHQRNGPPPLRLPVVSHGAEYLVIGYLMRRNILAYKAPPNNEGYDIICIHSDPKRVTKQIRVQVKSRYQTDSDRGFPIKGKSFAAIDYVVVAFSNIGYFYSDVPSRRGLVAPEFYTLPISFVRKHHHEVASGFDRVLTSGLDIESYKDEQGFELIAKDLHIPYPSRRSRR